MARLSLVLDYHDVICKYSELIIRDDPNNLRDLTFAAHPLQSFCHDYFLKFAYKPQMTCLKTA